MRAWALVGVVLALGAGAGGRRLAGQVAPTPDVKVVLGATVDIQLNSSSVAGEPGSTFETRRASIGATLLIDHWIGARVRPDFSLGELKLTDAWVDLGFSPRFGLRLGQFKKPFSRIELTSSNELPMIERALRIRGIDDAFRLEQAVDAAPVLDRVNGELITGEEQLLLGAQGFIGRDLGAAAHGTLGRVSYEAGIFNGAGPNHLENDGAKSVAARVTWRAGRLPLDIGAAVHRQTVAFTDSAGAARHGRGTAWELDAAWGAFRVPGPHALVEVTRGRNVFENGAAFAGFQGVASWYGRLRGGRAQGIEAFARASYGDPNRRERGDAGWLLTPGASLWFAGLTRLQLDWDEYRPAGRLPPERAVRAQVIVSF